MGKSRLAYSHIAEVSNGWQGAWRFRPESWSNVYPQLAMYQPGNVADVSRCYNNLVWKWSKIEYLSSNHYVAIQFLQVSGRKSRVARVCPQLSCDLKCANHKVEVSSFDCRYKTIQFSNTEVGSAPKVFSPQLIIRNCWNKEKMSCNKHLLLPGNHSLRFPGNTLRAGNDAERTSVQNDDHSSSKRGSAPLCFRSAFIACLNAANSVSASPTL